MSGDNYFRSIDGLAASRDLRCDTKKKTTASVLSQPQRTGQTLSTGTDYVATSHVEMNKMGMPRVLARTGKILGKINPKCQNMDLALRDVTNMMSNGGIAANSFVKNGIRMLRIVDKDGNIIGEMREDLMPCMVDHAENGCGDTTGIRPCKSCAEL